MGKRDSQRDFQVSGQGSLYRRPSVAAWVAAAGMAVSLFLAGGFVRARQGGSGPGFEPGPGAGDLRREFNARTVALAGLTLSGKSFQALPEPVVIPERKASSGRQGQARFGPAWAVLEVGRAFSAPERQPGKLVKTPSATYRVVAVNRLKGIVMIDAGRESGAKPGTRFTLSLAGGASAVAQVTTQYSNMAACRLLDLVVRPGPGDGAEFE